MKTAVVARPPVFGGRVKTFDDKAARSIEGVREVFEIPLVRARRWQWWLTKFWTAKQARDRLKIDWDVSA